MAEKTFLGTGSPERLLTDDDVRRVVQQGSQRWDLSGQRVLVIIPDATRTAPLPLFFRLLGKTLGAVTTSLDYLIALGTHQPLDDAARLKLVGLTPASKAAHYPQTKIFNHRWERDETFFTAGSISAADAHNVSQGMLSVEVPVRFNRLVLDYDVLLVCGPVFPHEVAGFSGGSKYFSPGISGPEIINFTHWLGALHTSRAIIGVKDTAVRRVIERAASFIPRPRLACCFVTRQNGLAGVYWGEVQAAWSAAADLSAQVHVRYVDQPYRQVLSVMPAMYADLWTAAKGMYKVEPVVADGGEVIIYAPHIDTISYTHGKLIDQIGYHVRDYFVQQWEQYKDYPWGVLAHSTHLRGAGSYSHGVEQARIRVSLASAIPEEHCRRVNLGYRDPRGIDPAAWEGREGDGILVVPRAGEDLYRLK